jgi:hypothetical protein
MFRDPFHFYTSYERDYACSETGLPEEIRQPFPASLERSGSLHIIYEASRN